MTSEPQYQKKGEGEVMVHKFRKQRYERQGTYEK